MLPQEEAAGTIVLVCGWLALSSCSLAASAVCEEETASETKGEEPQTNAL